MMKIAPFLLAVSALVLTPASGAFELDRLSQSQDRGGAPLAAPLAPVTPPPGTLRGPGRARDAVRRGEILSLETVAQRVQARYPGRLLDVRLDESAPRPIYHLKMLTRDGRVLQLAVDARTAQVVGVSGR